MSFDLGLLHNVLDFCSDLRIPMVPGPPALSFRATSCGGYNGGALEVGDSCRLPFRLSGLHNHLHGPSDTVILLGPLLAARLFLH